MVVCLIIGEIISVIWFLSQTFSWPLFFIWLTRGQNITVLGAVFVGVICEGFWEAIQKKQSFLSHWLGRDTYDMFKRRAPKDVVVGCCIYGVIYALSFCCHWSWVSELLSWATGYSLFFIAYLFIAIVFLDREVEMEAGNEKNCTYALTVLWNILLLIAGFAAMYYSDKYAEKYSLECSTVGYEEYTNTYHIFEDCENTNGSVRKMKGYEAIEKGAKLCGSCEGIMEEDMAADDAPNFIVGNFSGKGIDTLECVPYGPKTEWNGDSVQINWKIKSKQGTCKSMLIEGQYEPKMVFEGDLDGDGADEFSYLTNSLMSTMEQYWVFTYKDGVWKWLCEPRGLWTFHYDALCERGIDIVEPSHKKGYVTVHYTQYSEDGEHRIRTKQVKVNPTAISR